MTAKVIIVQGPPASGKTTMATKISRDLGLPVIAKDTIKEFLFDELGTRDREWSSTLGGISTDIAYLVAEGLLLKGEIIVMESAFFTDVAHDKMETLLAKTGAACLEVYCTADPDTRRQRFIDRNESGKRHAGHVDHFNYSTTDADEADVKYAPLKPKGSTLLTVDTTNFHEEDYQKLLADIAVFVQA